MGIYPYMKRILDLIFSGLLLPVFLLIYLIVLFLIKIEDKGPVFYLGARLGKDGTKFRMYKFRSMIQNAPDLRNEDGSTFNSDDDRRLTKVGRFLRKTSLDELPQIINVFLGHMSFIGPRPDLPEHFLIYNEHQKRKLCVRPGITGYNQAYFRNSISWFERIENDIYYVKNISFLFDLKILFKTIFTVISRHGVNIQTSKVK